MIKLTRGLDLPLEGEPKQSIDQARPVRTVAILAPDYLGMKPSMSVSEGDRVKKGQVLFLDKKTPGVQYTAPGAGQVAAINRGAKRVFQSVVIELEGDEEEEFPILLRFGPDGAFPRAGPGQSGEIRAVDGTPHPPVQQGARAGGRAALDFRHRDGYPAARSRS